MVLHKEAALRVESFSNNNDLEFRIESKAEMLSILQGIVDHGTHVALYYGGERNFILTILLGVNKDGMWLDVGPFPPDNKQLLLSDKVIFVSVHRHVKIQFVAHGARSELFENNEAFYLELPDYLLRIQRRDFFRIDVPSSSPVKCIIPVTPENPGDPKTMREASVMDISGGGVGLLCDKNEDILLPGKNLPDCRISIPHVGSLNVTLEVQNIISFTTPNNVVHKRAGCRFIRPDNQMAILLQGYIIRLQRERLILGTSD